MWRRLIATKIEGLRSCEVYDFMFMVYITLLRVSLGVKQKLRLR